MAKLGRPVGSVTKTKPFRDALHMEACALANGEQIDHPRGSLRWNAQRLLMSGECQSVREIADRLDGKPAQAIGQDTELGPLVVRWLEPVEDAVATKDDTTVSDTATHH